MGKIKEICKKHREILMYLLFGVLTTAVGWIVYFAVLWALKGIMGIPVDDTSSGRYFGTSRQPMGPAQGISE